MRYARCAALWGLLFALLAPFAARAGINLPGGLTVEQDCGAGESCAGVLEIINTGSETAQVQVYQTDYLFYADGSNIYGPPGRNPRSNAGWITLSPRRLTIPPHQKAALHYTIQVPADRGLIGSYWSLIMVEEVDSGSPAAGEPEEKQLNLKIKVRYAVQMITDIGGSGRRELSFLEPRLLKEEGGTILQVDLLNSGELWLRASLWVELYDEQGVLADKRSGASARLYPDTSVRRRLDLRGLPPGDYQALVVADCGGDDLFGARYTVRIGK